MRYECESVLEYKYNVIDFKSTCMGALHNNKTFGVT